MLERLQVFSALSHSLRTEQLVAASPDALSIVCPFCLFFVVCMWLTSLCIKLNRMLRGYQSGMYIRISHLFYRCNRAKVVLSRLGLWLCDALNSREPMGWNYIPGTSCKCSFCLVLGKSVAARGRHLQGKTRHRFAVEFEGRLCWNETSRNCWEKIVE